MEAFLGILSWWLVLIGSFSTFLLVSGLIKYLFFLIKEIMERQIKIRCLCKHEYIIDAKWFGWGYVKHDFKCRKCGKVLRINVFDNNVGDKYEV